MSAETITKIKKFFEDKPVIKAYLFGSYARNEEDEKSDIDILVELEYTKKIGIEFIRMQMALEKLLEKKVDLISEGGLTPIIKPYIDKEKILVYEKRDR